MKALQLHKNSDCSASTFQLRFESKGVHFKDFMQPFSIG